MATNLNNNIHINSFTKGMNTDTSYDMVSNELYVFGKNIRITLNSLLNSESNANYKEGILTPICVGKEIEISDINCKEILATASIENTGVIICRNNDGEESNTWTIYRIIKDKELFIINSVFTSTCRLSKDKHKLSVVLNKEQENIIKLYIADGEHLVMQLNVHESQDEYNSNLDGNVDYIMQNRLFPDDKVQILKIISGNLKSSLVQYVYRFYKKHGISSKLSPITNKIQVISSNRNIEEGNKEDTETSMGFRLHVPCNTHDWIHKVFDKILIFRLQYVTVNSDCQIYLICDKDIKDVDVLKFEDTGDAPLQLYSIEEFQYISGLDIIPLCIEQNQNYMFASNVKDETVLRIDDIDSRSFSFNNDDKIVLYEGADYEGKYEFTSVNAVLSGEKTDNKSYYLNRYSDVNYEDEESDPCKWVPFNNSQKVLGGNGDTVSWKFITTNITTHDTSNLDFNPPKSDVKDLVEDLYYISNESLIKTGKTTDDYFKQLGIHASQYIGYDDIVTSSMLRSLRLNEVYRYGVIYYNKYGNRSEVQWIGDIRTPDYKDYVLLNKILDLDTEAITYTTTLNASSYIKYTITVYSSGMTPNTREHQIATQIRSDKYIITAGSSYECSFTKDVNGTISAKDRQFKLVKNGMEIDGKLETRYYSLNNSHTETYALKTIDDNGNVISLPNSGTVNKDTEVWFEIEQFKYNVPGECLYWEGEPIKNQLNLTVDDLVTCSVNMSLDCKLFYIKGLTIITNDTKKCISNPLGIHFDVKLDKNKDIVGCQIVRCKKSKQYTKNIHQCFATSTAMGAGSNVPYLPAGITSPKSDAPVLLFSPYITTYPESTKTQIKTSDLILKPILSAHVTNASYSNESYITPGFENFPSLAYSSYKEFSLFHYYDIKGVSNSNKYYIEDLDNVLVLTWDKIYTNITLNGSEISGGVLAYKTALTTVKNYQYVNAVMGNYYNTKVIDAFTYIKNNGEKHTSQIMDPIGCGPKCQVAAVSKINENSPTLFDGNIVTLQHNASQFAGINKEDHQYDTYYGFGNYCKLIEDGDYMVGSIDVFDGDVYRIPCEIIHKYKMYNSNSIERIHTEQLIQYVPLETEMNTFFNYGMNYRNTHSQWIQPEPGNITGVSAQARPDFLYNNIYSDNDISNDIYTVQPIEKQNDIYPQRTFFSDLKTNGETFDSWNVFRTLNYIDADTRYGLITNLLSLKDLLYYWQTNAFGKFSINERSLITDNNSNLILLGTGGVVQKADYIDVIHGMRKDDFSAISAENNLFWIDVINKAIVTYNNLIINYSEFTNVLNVINNNMTDDFVPYINYDQLNQELICKCLNNDLLVFNLKLNCASSVYTRKYDHTIILNNTLYGLIKEGLIYKFNYINEDDKGTVLKPIHFKFVVNPSSSITKVFDNLEVTVLNLNENNIDDFLTNKYFKFSTNLYETDNNPDDYTYREGNIKYAIPRFGNNMYGNRMRGKWMSVDIINNNPSDDEAISHIITKFRQSFS